MKKMLKTNTSEKQLLKDLLSSRELAEMFGVDVGKVEIKKVISRKELSDFLKTTKKG